MNDLIGREEGLRIRKLPIGVVINGPLIVGLLVEGLRRANHPKESLIRQLIQLLIPYLGLPQVMV